jgi:hypothetical protein
MGTHPRATKQKRRFESGAVAASLAFNGLALTGLALGARHAAPLPEDRSIELSLVRIPVYPPTSVSPSRNTGRSISPRPTARRDQAPPAIPVAPSPSPAPRIESQEARGPRRLDLGCYGLATDERAKCEQRRWQAPAQNDPNSGFGPLARLDPEKRAALDSVAADQAACLDYKKHIGTPMPWSLRDILKKGFC